MRPDTPDDDPDPQARAEVEDETHLSDDAEFATLEEAPDVYDATEREGDRSDEEAFAADAADLDPDLLDEEQAEDDEREEGADDYEPEVEWAEAAGDDGSEARAAVEEALPADDIEGLDEVGDADSVEGGEDDFTNFQSSRLSDADLDALGYRRTGGRDS